MQRPYADNTSVLAAVQFILNEVKLCGDDAVKSFTKKFEGVDVKNFLVTEEEFVFAQQAVPDELKKQLR